MLVPVGHSLAESTAGSGEGSDGRMGIAMALRSSLIGQSIADYRITSVLGRGGMSEVYAAEDTRSKCEVALKVLTAQFADSASFRERFLRESRLASSLAHPHIVPIFEAGEDEGLMYIAMQHVKGIDLGTLIAAHSPLRPAQVASWISQIASALDAAHDRGLIHRDVKPANILIAQESSGDEFGGAYLTDFGLTKTVDSDSRYTETGNLVGSVHYMAPERIEGAQLTSAADVYSLGCVLFECLTSAPPYERDTDLAVLWAHVNAELPSVTSKRADLKSSLDAVLHRALMKAPEKRYPTGGELACDFRRALRARRSVVGSRPRGDETLAVVSASVDGDVDLDTQPGRIDNAGVGRITRHLAIATLVLGVTGGAFFAVDRLGLATRSAREPSTASDNLAGALPQGTTERQARKVRTRKPVNRAVRNQRRAPRSDRVPSDDTRLATAGSPTRVTAEKPRSAGSIDKEDAGAPSAPDVDWVEGWALRQGVGGNLRVTFEASFGDEISGWVSARFPDDVRKKGTVDCGAVQGRYATFGGTWADGSRFVVKISDEPDGLILGDEVTACDNPNMGTPGQGPFDDGDITIHDA